MPRMGLLHRSCSRRGHLLLLLLVRVQKWIACWAGDVGGSFWKKGNFKGGGPREGELWLDERKIGVNTCWTTFFWSLIF